MQVNEHIHRLPAGYLFSEIAARVKAFDAANPGDKLIRLGIGDVTRPLAPSVAGAFAKAAQGMAAAEGFFGYGPDGGYSFLKKAILDADYRALGIALDEDEIFISDGAKTDTSAIQELFSLDALIAVTDPVYPVYVDANAMAGRLGEYRDGRWSRLSYLPCVRENGFVPALPAKRVDVVYLCYPNNPTGTVLPKDELQKIVDWARANETLIIYDAAYKAFISEDGLPRSIYQIPGADEVAVECCSFSKTAGFTGVRCGYTVIPKALKGRLAQGERVSLNALWRRRLQSTSNGVSYPVQRAAEAVYSAEGQKEIKEILDYYKTNASMISEGLNQAGLPSSGGANAPYVWLSTPKGMDGWSFFDYLLREARVVGTPGEGFGPSGASCFRLTAFNTHENTREAVLRIQDALKKL